VVAVGWVGCYGDGGDKITCKNNHDQGGGKRSSAKCIAGLVRGRSWGG